MDILLIIILVTWLLCGIITDLFILEDKEVRRVAFKLFYFHLTIWVFGFFSLTLYFLCKLMDNWDDDEKYKF